MTSLARLHVVTHDEVVSRPDFIRYATSVMTACGPDVAVHVRMKKANARTLLETAVKLCEVARATGSMVFVNERIDVAVSAGADGVQLGQRSIPMEAARRASESLSARPANAPHGRILIGYSAHAASEAIEVAADGADLLFLGTIWPSTSHPGECTSGTRLLSDVSSSVSCPVLAIGGVTPPRAQEAMIAGAHGVAVITGVWDAADPVAAAMAYIEAMQATT